MRPTEQHTVDCHLGQPLKIGNKTLEVLEIDEVRGEVRLGVTDPDETPPYREVLISPEEDEADLGWIFDADSQKTEDGTDLYLVSMS